MHSRKDNKRFRAALDEYNKLATKKLKEMIADVENGNIENVKSDLNYLSDKMEEVNEELK